ncbi:hypothetical protein [Streptomyces lunalinharesii]|uniref:Uncharacterized protein n=1 Tax=Streptomyces lunalinharesii TaxID=333384 RepID=A0ABP6EPV9_9ACTN
MNSNTAVGTVRTARRRRALRLVATGPQSGGPHAGQGTSQPPLRAAQLADDGNAEVHYLDQWRHHAEAVSRGTAVATSETGAVLWASTATACPLCSAPAA